MKETIGTFLLRRLDEVGIRHIFGVPGDYNLEFMQQLEDRGRPAWIGNCNELNGSYAADGYARLTGLSALIVTHGVGALSALNGIAGAFAEHVPVIVICGSIPTKSIERGLMMHHTLADGSQNGFLRAFAEVTIAQAQLTPANAVREIDRVIRAAWQSKRPVYLELPSDVAFLEVDAPELALMLELPSCDEERLTECAQAIVKRLDQAASPAVLLDMDTERYAVLHEAAELATKLQLPIATMPGSKGAFSERSPLSLGVYGGASSPAKTRTAIEQSDCLITIGFRRTDATSGFFTDDVPANAIHLRGTSAEVDEANFQGITLKALLKRIIDLVGPKRADAVENAQETSPNEDLEGGPLLQKDYWPLMQNFLRRGDVLLAEDGTSSAGASTLRLPEGCTFITQAIWGSIGYTLGSLLGTLIAAPERRHILFIGDGSFQLTAQELSTILRHDLKPFIFLINNGGYTIERTIEGKNAKYNDVADWHYADLVKVFCRTANAESYVVTTAVELKAVLDGEHTGLVFVESVMPPGDAPLGLIKAGHASANLDYGPRGPQFAPDAQIPLPATK